MNASRAVRRLQSGFSLVELLIVVAIIVILAAVALPSIATFIRNYRIRGAAQQVASEIQAARTKAIMKNANLGVVFVPLSQTQYRVVVEDVPAPVLVELLISPPDPSVRRPLTMLTAPPFEARQAGPIRELPLGVQFALDAATCTVTPGFTPNSNGVRFDRLGQRCSPGALGCATIDVGADAAMDAGANGSTFCVYETVTGLSRLVRVGPGGRVVTLP